MTKHDSFLLLCTTIRAENEKSDFSNTQSPYTIILFASKKVGSWLSSAKENHLDMAINKYSVFIQPPPEIEFTQWQGRKRTELLKIASLQLFSEGIDDLGKPWVFSFLTMILSKFHDGGSFHQHRFVYNELKDNNSDGRGEGMKLRITLHSKRRSEKEVSPLDLEFSGPFLPASYSPPRQVFSFQYPLWGL